MTKPAAGRGDVNRENRAGGVVEEAAMQGEGSSIARQRDWEEAAMQEEGWENEVRFFDIL